MKKSRALQNFATVILINKSLILLLLSHLYFIHCNAVYIMILSPIFPITTTTTVL